MNPWNSADCIESWVDSSKKIWSLNNGISVKTKKGASSPLAITWIQWTYIVRGLDMLSLCYNLVFLPSIS